MKSTYKEKDVILLLKDITGQVEPLENDLRERLIQSGISYCEMLPREYPPSEKYLSAYRNALSRNADITAKAVGIAADKIYADRGGKPVIVSLARAGTPVGILIKRYLEKKYKIEVPHYSVSIIRGRGIDKNAIKFILSKHKAEQIQFVDGWTGKGAIQRQLNEAMADFPEICTGIAVLSDPAGVAEKCGTAEDFLIPNSCLNSTVSGLISRTFLRSDIIGENDFHGAVYYEEFEEYDLTYDFIDAVESCFSFDESCNFCDKDRAQGSGLAETYRIAEHLAIDNINLVKPSIGETTRVLLRRIPDKVLVHSLNDRENLGHIYQLAAEKGVAVEEYPLENYKACGIIRKLADN